jgi:hypothetical protein
MQIVIKSNAADLYRSYVCLGKVMNNDGWYDTLKQIEGKTLDVETEYLFQDQYNTAPIPGVSPNVLRIFDFIVERVIDDIRGTKMRCNWCGKTNDKGNVCPECGKSEYIETFTLWRDL